MGNKRTSTKRKRKYHARTRNPLPASVLHLCEEVGNVHSHLHNGRDRIVPGVFHRTAAHHLGDCQPDGHLPLEEQARRQDARPARRQERQIRCRQLGRQTLISDRVSKQVNK